jgi:hypothetical protein
MPERQTMEKIMAGIQVSNGFIGGDKTVVEFDGSAITVRRGMFGNRVATIPVSRVTQVGWKTPLLAGHGHIEFVAADVEGKVAFRLNKRRQFEALRDAVQAAMARPPAWADGDR